MDYEKLFPGRFVKAVDLEGKDRTLTISRIRLESLPQDGGAERVKGIVAFAEAKKELVLNRTNAECLRAMFGRDTDTWIGKKVTLYPMALGEEGFAEFAIRVRGSPDLAEPVEFDLKLPRKKPRKTRLVPTGQKPPQEKPRPVAPEPQADGAAVEF